jgi:hypothetical protein
MPIEGAWRDQTWQRLSELDPEDTCRRSLATTGEDGALLVPFLNIPFRIHPADRVVEGPKGVPEDEMQLVLLNYLIRASDTPPGGKWVNEKALAGGELFFNGPHALPVADLGNRFGSDCQAFLEAGRKLGGEPMEFGDASVRLQPLPRIPLVCILWEKDEEFPPSVTHLFDPTADHHLALDAILGMVKRVGLEMVAAAGSA